MSALLRHGLLAGCLLLSALYLRPATEVLAGSSEPQAAASAAHVRVAGEAVAVSRSEPANEAQPAAAKQRLRRAPAPAEPPQTSGPGVDLEHPVTTAAR